MSCCRCGDGERVLWSFRYRYESREEVSLIWAKTTTVTETYGEHAHLFIVVLPKKSVISSAAGKQFGLLSNNRRILTEKEERLNEIFACNIITNSMAFIEYLNSFYDAAAISSSNLCKWKWKHFNISDISGSIEHFDRNHSCCWTGAVWTGCFTFHKF